MSYLYVNNVAVSESATAVDFVVRLDAPSLNQVTVNFSTANGTAVGNSDVIGQAGTLTFAPGETSKSIHVLLLDGTVAERTEAFWLNLSSAVNATITQASATATIFDNDGTPGTPAISVSDVVVDESGKTATFLVSLDKPSILPVSVSYGTTSDTAFTAQDFVGANGILNFVPGEMVKAVTVDLINDLIAENDEFFKLVLANPSAATMADPIGVAMIGHNDAPPTSTPQILLTPVAVGENQSSADFLVQLSAPSLNEVRVDFSTANGTAVGNSDVQGRTGTLVFAPGETTGSVRVLLLDDTVAEQAQAFWLNLSGPVNATLAQASTTATIYDNDGTTGTPAISIADMAVDESTNIARFSVWLDRPSTSTVTVRYSTADDTAKAGQDFLAGAGTLSFAPGEVVKTVAVDIVNDALAEVDESFQVLLSGASNATIADGVGAGMIGRSDTALVSQPQVLLGPVVVSEGDTSADFLVQLSAPSANQVRVNFSTANGTAVGNSDVQGRTGTLSFEPGQTTQTVRVLLLNDTVVEQTEAFWLDLSGAVNATIPQARMSATIIDNDGATTYSYGIGNDQYTVASVSDRIAESVNGGIDTARSSVSYSLPDNVENLVLSGAALSGFGNAGNNIFRGTSVNNTFDGKEGIDTVVFSGPRASYALVGDTALRTVSGGVDGTDTLFSIERLQFSDQILASDTLLDGNTYKAYAMINAAFDRAPSAQELSQWTAQLDRLGGNTRDLAQTMINFYAPGVPNEVLVAHLWSTIIETPIPPDMLSYFVGLVANGTFTQASLLERVAVIDENAIEVVGIIGQTLPLDPAWFPIPGG
ncbi:MAG: hypothetical protein IPP44_07800 [Ideonella sp.]|nr:hypothetical protein [Ideonella sp.]